LGAQGVLDGEHAAAGVDETRSGHAARVGSWTQETSWAAGLAEAAFAVLAVPPAAAERREHSAGHASLRNAMARGRWEY
jgi:hypothetical protein